MIDKIPYADHADSHIGRKHGILQQLSAEQQNIAGGGTQQDERFDSNADAICLEGFIPPVSWSQTLPKPKRFPQMQSP